MGKIVAFANQKGGSGKSTLSANIAVLWSNSNYKVAVIDGDAQKSLTYWMEARKKYYGDSDIGIDTFPYNSRSLESDIKQIKRKYNFRPTTGAKALDFLCKILDDPDITLYGFTHEPYAWHHGKNSESEIKRSFDVHNYKAEKKLFSMLVKNKIKYHF